MRTRFLAVPDPKLAEEHLRILTQAPHMAGTPEDKATADYVAQKFRDAGLETEIVEYRVWMNYPAEITVDMTAPAGVTMHGPTRERVSADPYQDDPRVVMPFNSMSPSGDVEAEVVYANYGSPDDFQKLEQMKIDVRGKIVLVRYGQNFRGVKAFVAQEHGAAGVLIYSDPADDGWRRGDKYPQGPWRPDTGVQRGSIGYMFQFPGDPTTPGIASVPDLPGFQTHASRAVGAVAKNSRDADFLRRRVADPRTSGRAGLASRLARFVALYLPRWPGADESEDSPQTGLPVPHHLGRDRPHSRQRAARRMGGRGQSSRCLGVRSGRSQQRHGGHAGIGSRHRRTAEIGLEAEAHHRASAAGTPKKKDSSVPPNGASSTRAELANAVAYFNMDVAVSGPKFGASSVPTLKQFIRDVTKVVPSPKGGMVYDDWRKTSQAGADAVRRPTADIGGAERLPAAGNSDVPVGDLGSGSDYTVFLQHLGVPSSDVSSSGSYGVYHSVFDNFNWFKKFGDPDFVYEQEMARVFGLEAIRMSDADVLPYDYEQYGKEIAAYIDARAGKRRWHSAVSRPTLPRRFAPPISSSRPEPKFGASRKIPGMTPRGSIRRCARRNAPC